MERPLSKRPSGCGLVSWLLILMALATLTPCLLLPEWRAYQAVRMAEQAEQHRLDSLRCVVERERCLLEATRDDPAVIARLAQRDLRFHHVDQRPIRVAVPRPQALEEHSFTPAPAALPPAVAHAASWLPDYDYDAVFHDDQTRLVVIAMAVGLLGVGLWLPSRRSAGRYRRRQAPR